MKTAERTGSYRTNAFDFCVQNCTIWYDSDGNGTVDTNETWADFKANPNHDQNTNDAVEAQLDALGCWTP